MTCLKLLMYWMHMDSQYFSLIFGGNVPCQATNFVGSVDKM